MEHNQNFIETLTVEQVPWKRLSTPYGRATEFPQYFIDLGSKQADKMKQAMKQISMHTEHQSTLWSVTPFAMIFLVRIFKQLIADEKENHVFYPICADLLALFVTIADCYHMAGEMEHAAPLPDFADQLKEEYLFPEHYDEEDDELWYEEESFPNDLFYSFYYYAYQVLLYEKLYFKKLTVPALDKQVKELVQLL